MRWWKLWALGGTACLAVSDPALAQVSSDKAAARAASRARTCYVDLSDGRLKCGGRPQRSLAEARKLLAPGSLVKAQELSNCKTQSAAWIFKWRALPNQPAIAVDSDTGRVVDCGA